MDYFLKSKSNVVAILLPLAFLIAIPLANISVADEAAEWEEAQNRLALIEGENRCEELWDILWPFAKSGNIEARKSLLFLMAPPPDMSALFSPSNTSNDLLGQYRDIVTMAVHSDAHKNDGSEDNSYSEAALAFYEIVGFKESARGRTFIECVKSGKSNCATIAVTEQLVPSFDEYAAQQDLFLSNGQNAHCTE